MEKELEKLLRVIEAKLEWGDSKSWQSRDFENLNQRILEETGVSLSASTLRRLWGKVEYKHLPSATTLDTMSKFAGYESWRVFQKQNQIETIQESTSENKESNTLIKSPQWKKLAWIIPAIIIISLAGLFAIKRSKPLIKADNYSFSSRPVTRQIPNSVIFTYDATSSPVDSIYIQQSWDGRTKTLVDKKLHQHTSVYYEPGFYHAKLFIGDEIVKEHPLMIPTDGWLGLIGQQTIPVYLQREDFIHNDSMALPVAVIEKNNIRMEPMPPVVKYYNVGNFEAVPVSDFSFNAEVKNEYKQGAGACQFVYIMLITDDAPISIPLSAPGCVSELNLRSVDEVVSGKKTDLSAFGVDFSKWVQVSCKNATGKIQFYINGKTAYECALPTKDVKIVGMAFMFQATGAVRKISLDKSNTIVFHSF